jgi:hypothetical protein
MAAIVFLCLSLILASSMNAENANLTTGACGIEGLVSISPTHGGPSRQGVNESAPMANTPFIVEGTAGTVATFTTDEQGKFHVPLPPGRYSIRIKTPAMKGRGCGLVDIQVTSDGFKKITLNCDSGMR